MVDVVCGGLDGVEASLNIDRRIKTRRSHPVKDIL